MQRCGVCRRVKDCRELGAPTSALPIHFSASLPRFTSSDTNKFHPECSITLAIQKNAYNM